MVIKYRENNNHRLPEVLPARPQRQKKKQQHSNVAFVAIHKG